MKVRVLGCSGGIGGQGLRTTSLLVDDDVLIDAGTGLTDLPLAALAAIDHVFITHSHLDHIAALPLMIDSVADLRDAPVVIHATAATLEAIRAHIFNWAIWPDFSEIAIRDRRIMRYETIRVGQRVRLGGRGIAAVPAEHTVPAVGYHLDSGDASLVFTGDTTANDQFWPVVNRIANLRYLIIETAFSDREEALARISKHLCPRLLFAELDKLSVPAEVYVTHLKPGQSEVIAGELGKPGGRPPPGILRHGQVFEF
ncbi:MBL fold metallo-hydrolase [Propionivibrio sp.]|jgi:ribonuclease BN (tRNA processing enzyme)|uniref:MBL fold metallo-hydrolase n=1 Tax=Propionivibrio sp. TaxID=2212460 RepID=UPI0039E32FBB